MSQNPKLPISPQQMMGTPTYLKHPETPIHPGYYSPLNSENHTYGTHQTDSKGSFVEKRKLSPSSSGQPFTNNDQTVLISLDSDPNGQVKGEDQLKQTTLDGVVPSSADTPHLTASTKNGKGLSAEVSHNESGPATKKPRVSSGSDRKKTKSANGSPASSNTGSKVRTSTPTKTKDTKLSNGNPIKSPEEVKAGDSGNTTGNGPISGSMETMEVEGDEMKISNDNQLGDAANGSKGALSEKQNGKPTETGDGTNTQNKTTNPSNGEHLDHPENWATGDDPATEKQKGYIKVLENQNGESNSNLDGLGKSEASEIIASKVSGDTNGGAEQQKNGSSIENNGIQGKETNPGDSDHLNHPENWTTGGDPATSKQKGFIKVLEKQKGVDAEDVENLGKSEASEKIEELKSL